MLLLRFIVLISATLSFAVFAKSNVVTLWEFDTAQLASRDVLPYEMPKNATLLQGSLSIRRY
ncbi:hypothetical protein ALON55S_08702 [Alishewanella longhuensis]